MNVPAFWYYPAFFACAFWDGMTRTVPVGLLVAVCVTAAGTAPPDPGTVIGAVILALPVMRGVRRGELGPADLPIVFAVGVRHGLSDGARAIASGFFGLALVVSLRRSGEDGSAPGATPMFPGATPGFPGATPMFPGATPVFPGGTAYPLVPALLAGEILVARGVV
ncbi:MAG: hypothetical protein ACLFSV_05650 [Alkalispirochaeta sp.]